VTKPSILVYGNCQAEEITLIGQQLHSLRDKASFKIIPLQSVTEQEWGTRYDDAYFSDVKVLWNQVETGTPTVHRLELEKRTPVGCPVVKFPPLTMLALWPFSGHDPRLAIEGECRYSWTDSIAASLSKRDASDDALFDAYMQISTEKMPDLIRRLRMDVTRWRAVDALADIKVADWVLHNFRSTRLFYTTGHLSAPPLGYLLKALLERTTILTPDEISEAQRETDFLLHDHEGQDVEIVPLHPLVAERMELAYYDPNARHRWHGHEWLFREYILNYIRWEPYLE
jgi:hypothetical protein